MVVEDEFVSSEPPAHDTLRKLVVEPDELFPTASVYVALANQIPPPLYAGIVTSHE